jgi:hypothetical protein
MEVIFQILRIFKLVLGSTGPVPKMLQNCFELYWTSPTNVTKHVLLNSAVLILGWLAGRLRTVILWLTQLNCYCNCLLELSLAISEEYYGYSYEAR